MPPAPPSSRTSRVVALLAVLAGLLGAQAAVIPTASAAPSEPSPAPSASASSTVSSTPDPAPSPGSSTPVVATTSPAPPRATTRRAVAAGPTAVDDSAATQLGAEATLPGAKNDSAGSAAIRAALTVFPTDQLPSLPSGSRIYDAGRSLDVNHHGTFKISTTDGSVTFTPWTGLTGVVAARYRITDAAGATDDGRLSVVVTAGTTVSDDAFAYEGVPLSVDLLTNDVPGRNADGTPGTIDRTSVRFPDQSSDGGSITISSDRRTLSYSGVGVLTVDDRGVLTFDPDPSLRGAGDVGSISYSARDTTRGADGTVQHHTYHGFIRLGVYPNHPITTNDQATTPFNTPVTLPGSLNDQNTNPGLLFLTEDARFLSLTQPGPGDYRSPDGRVLHWAGKGTFSINADGSVLFAPTPGFVGRTGADMLVYDSQGTRGQEGLDVTVRPGPSARPDTVPVRQNVTTTFSVLTNDEPGTDAHGTPGTIDPTSVRFTDDTYEYRYQVSTDRRTLTVPGQGVLSISATTGAVTFDPEPRFTGTVGPFSYGARDTVTTTAGVAVHNPVASTFTVTVVPATPVALNNWANTTVGVPVEVPVLGNDRPGDPSAPLDPTTVRLRLSGGGLPQGSTSSDYDHTITIPGRGVYHVRDDGVVVCTPAPGFSGVVPTIRYDVRDTNGTMAIATVTVGVAGAGS